VFIFYLRTKLINNQLLIGPILIERNVSFFASVNYGKTVLKNVVVFIL
jgi:hypothetical protein